MVMIGNRTLSQTRLRRPDYRTADLRAVLGAYTVDVEVRLGSTWGTPMVRWERAHYPCTCSCTAVAAGGFTGPALQLLALFRLGASA